MHFSAGAPLNRHGARQYPIVSRYNAHYHAPAGHRNYEKTHTKYKYKISIPYGHGNKILHYNIRFSCTYQIIVADAADAVSVNFSGRCKFLQI